MGVPLHQIIGTHQVLVASLRLCQGLFEKEDPKLSSQVSDFRLAKDGDFFISERNVIINDNFLQSSIHVEDDPVYSFLSVALPLKSSLYEAGILGESGNSGKDVAVPFVLVDHIAGVNFVVEKGGVVDELRDPLPLGIFDPEISKAGRAGREGKVAKLTSVFFASGKSLLVVGHLDGTKNGFLPGSSLVVDSGEVGDILKDSFVAFVFGDELEVSLGPVLRAAPREHDLTIILYWLY